MFINIINIINLIIVPKYLQLNKCISIIDFTDSKRPPWINSREIIVAFEINQYIPYSEIDLIREEVWSIFTMLGESEGRYFLVSFERKMLQF